MFHVRFAGPQVTVQDGGRPGLMRFGVPASGPMDRKSLTIANMALGNAPGANAIEVSRGGLTLDCVSGAVTVAVVGGGFVVDHPDGRGGSWRLFCLSAGQTLVIRPGHWGSWTYLAFSGNLVAREWLGSTATHGPSGFGGGAVSSGQMIEIADARDWHRADDRIPCPVWARPRRIVKAVAGPQERFFAPQVLDAFFAEPFVLTDACDRMGWRLHGPDLTPDAALSVPSEAILRGSVQVAGDGVATVLLSDHQTTGGYPKIATMISDDVDGFVQLRPRDRVRFQSVSADQALQTARQRAAALVRYLAQLDAWRGSAADRQPVRLAGPQPAGGDRRQWPAKEPTPKSG